MDEKALEMSQLKKNSIEYVHVSANCTDKQQPLE